MSTKTPRIVPRITKLVTPANVGQKSGGESQQGGSRTKK